jgi:hypothetical protein
MGKNVLIMLFEQVFKILKNVQDIFLRGNQRINGCLVVEKVYYQQILDSCHQWAPL